MPTPSDAWKSDLPTVAAAIVKCEVNFVVVILVPVVIVLIVVDSNEYINIVEVAVCKFFFFNCESSRTQRLFGYYTELTIAKLHLSKFVLCSICYR